MSPVRLTAPAPALLPRIGRHQLRFFEPDDGGNPAGGTGQGAGQGQDPAPGNDPAAGLRSALQRHQNDAMALAAQLYSENFQLRERNRQLNAQAPAEGSVVLSREQAAQWTAYQQLGAPDALQTSLQGAQQATARLAQLERTTLIRSVADAARWDAEVLAQLPGAGELTFEVREIEADGKKRPAAFVTPKDGQATPIETYAQQHWAKFLPALAQSSAAPAPQGTNWPPQQGGASSGGTDILSQAMQRFQEQRDAAPNPFRPAPAQNPTK